MKLRKSLLLLILSVASVATPGAEAEDTPPAPSIFVEEATLDSLAEIELGRIALTKSSDPEIRRFAQRMVTDHSKAREEIASLARAKGLDIPADLDAEHRTIIANIAREEDAAFDRAYCEHMVMKHTKAMALFESATKASDADLAAFAKQKLPTLEQHKELATKLPD